MKSALVITSIGHPTSSMKELARITSHAGAQFYCIGDQKSPGTFSLEGCRFVDLREQQAGQFELGKLLPVGHYSRKNIGYLLAVDDGADEILETDDDNSPLDDFWQPRKRSVTGRLVREKGWVNAYSHFTDQRIWPRGFPLEEIERPDNQTMKTIEEETITSPVQQALADGDTDVDAIYRMTNANLVTFSRKSPLILGQGTWCPFNSQNTWWDRSAFVLMYLPSYCTFRMTDIWRSFVAQACLWANGWRLSFHSATVYQDRNPHNLLMDFEAEVPGYLNNSRIVERLGKLNLKTGGEYLFENMFSCYRELVGMGLVGKEELEILLAWQRDLTLAGLSMHK